MHTPPIEKRRYPRLDTSGDERCTIRVYGMKGRPVEGQVLNLSFGGVAFLSDYRTAARTVNRFNTKVEIRLPGGSTVKADSSLARILPNPSDDTCVCVLELMGMGQQHSTKLRRCTGLR